MKPVNIYLQSRIKDACVFNSVHRHISKKTFKVQTKEHEISSLEKMVNALFDAGVSVEAFDGFFYCYQIPRIGKEFDLLKFKSNAVLNIELKSQAVPEKQILEQLLRNKYYLSHLGNENIFFTVETSSMTCYKLVDDSLVKSSIKEVASVICDFNSDFVSDITNLFRESDYLVSPMDTPEKFIRGEYFLTGAQEQIRNKIIQHIVSKRESGFFSIKGMPGTGKTLLLYDIAKRLSEIGETLIIHLGVAGASKDVLRKRIKGFNLCDSEDLKTTRSDGKKYSFVLVDEAHRVDRGRFNEILNFVREQNAVCIFSSNPEEILTIREKELGITSLINDVSSLGIFELSEKIRSNKDIHAFITVMKNLSRKDDFNTDYSDVEICFASNVNEAVSICSYYKRKGYVFIDYSRNEKSDIKLSLEDPFEKSRVIGVEFEKVVMLIDDSFFYDFSGKLEGVPVFNPEKLYPNPFYSSITRIRDKLAVVVLKDSVLFEKICSIISEK